MRRRLLDQVWSEELTIVSHRHETSEVGVRLVVDTDFADLFEVKDGVRPTATSWRHDDGDGTLDAQLRARRVLARCRIRPIRPRGQRCGFAYTLTLAPGASWTGPSP